MIASSHPALTSCLKWKPSPATEGQAALPRPTDTPMLRSGTSPMRKAKRKSPSDEDRFGRPKLPWLTGAPANRAEVLYKVEFNAVRA
jgi:hypothetical protein